MAASSQSIASSIRDPRLAGKPVLFGPFLDVETGNQVTLAFYETQDAFEPQHYAFLVSEAEFDLIFGRIKERGLDYWADPGKSRKGEINTHFGGRGVYFEDPGGHFLEIITRPYGSGG
jgi:catechol 2,3-dioxygenase-like lactoylglutathione lyase family enzyme